MLKKSYLHVRSGVAVHYFLGSVSSKNVADNDRGFLGEWELSLFSWTPIEEKSNDIIFVSFLSPSCVLLRVVFAICLSLLLIIKNKNKWTGEQYIYFESFHSSNEQN